MPGVEPLQFGPALGVGVVARVHEPDVHLRHVGVVDRRRDLGQAGLVVPLDFDVEDLAAAVFLKCQPGDYSYPGDASVE